MVIIGGLIYIDYGIQDLVKREDLLFLMFNFP